MSFEELEPLKNNYEKFKAKLQMLKADAISERMADSVMISHTSKSWICGRKHRVVHYKNGFKKIKNNKVKNAVTVVDRRETMECAHSKSTV